MSKPVASIGILYAVAYDIPATTSCGALSKPPPLSRSLNAYENALAAVTIPLMEKMRNLQTSCGPLLSFRAARALFPRHLPSRHPRLVL